MTDKPPPTTEKRWFSSELIAWALGLDYSETQRVKPSDILKSPLVNLAGNRKKAPLDAAEAKKEEPNG